MRTHLIVSRTQQPSSATPRRIQIVKVVTSFGTVPAAAPLGVNNVKSVPNRLLPTSTAATWSDEKMPLKLPEDDLSS